MFRHTILASLTTATLLLTAACGTDTTGGATGDTSSPTVTPTSNATVTEGPSPSAPSSGSPVSSVVPTSAPISDVTDAPTSSAPESSSSASEPPSSVATSGVAATLPVLACGDGTVLTQFIQLTPEQAVARKAELARTYRGATIAQLDTACTTPDHDPIVIAWWSVDGTTGNDTEDLFRLRRAQGNGRAVVLAMFPHGAYYYSSGLCSLTADGRAPRIGPDTPITSATKPWLFEMTSILAASGYIHPDDSGVAMMSAGVLAGVKAFQKAQGLNADGWIGPDTVAAAAKTVCRSGDPVATNL